MIKVCENCGKEFTVGRVKHQRFCSELCNRRAYRRAHGAASRTPHVGKPTALERAQQRRWKLLQDVIDAQRGPVEELWAKSQKWTKEQREFAKARYMKMHLTKYW